jgi:type VI secretion system Hcp family effector
MRMTAGMNTHGTRRPIARRLRLPIALVTAAAIALTLMVTHTGHRVARSEPRPVTIEAALAAFGEPSHLFMKVDGITGDSAFNGHVGEIDIDSLSWGLSNSKGNAKGTAFENTTVNKGLDSASPQILVATAQAKIFRTIEITAERIDEDSTQYAKLTFGNATFTSQHQDVTSDGGFKEKDTFTFTRVTLTYTIKGIDGPDQTYTGTWDLKTKLAA